MKPRLLDLFCGAGGAARGYQRAGFHVTGVDIKPQPRYAGDRFIQADALEYLGELLHHEAPLASFDAIHASPPCQAYTLMQAVADNKDAHDDLIPITRAMLKQAEVPTVMENVVGAPLIEPFMLCGSMFGLGISALDRELRRHRLFETDWPIGLVPSCAHQKRAVGIYGDHLRLGRRSSAGEISGSKALDYASHAMAIQWMTWAEIKEAIPPAYTELIGHQLMAQLERVAA